MAPEEQDEPPRRREVTAVDPRLSPDLLRSLAAEFAEPGDDVTDESDG